jgi:SWI/SNF-related matrix-associated actin-dependent regulator 1 of chromatin subfamily A
VEIEAARQAVIQGKLAACIEWIKDYLADNGKLVVFAWHTDTIHRLTQAFPGCVALTGDTPPQERQAIVDRFQNDPECRLFVGNIQAAGVGVTLTAASSVAFVEFAWTPGDMEQAYDRIHRIGQRQAVIAYYLVGQGTIDEDIADLLEQKRQIIETIHDGAPRAINMSILDDLTKRLLAKYGE